MVTKIQARHLKSTAIMAGAGAVFSASSYPISRPNYPVFSYSGQFIQPSEFSIHDHGWPFQFSHITCSGPIHACTNLLDGWGFLLNTAIWAVVISLLWFSYRRLMPAPRRRKK